MEITSSWNDLIFLAKEPAAEATRIHLEHQEIEELLPHRGGALLLDSIIIVTGTKPTAIGSLRIGGANDICRDHFNTAPSHWLGEFGDLTGAALCAYLLKQEHGVKMPIKLLRLSDEGRRNRNPVFPGDDVECQVTLHHWNRRTAKFSVLIINKATKKHVMEVKNITGMILP